MGWRGEWPTVLLEGSEVPPGALRLLGTTRSGGWANPARHTARTGVAVVAAGRKRYEEGEDGVTLTLRGDAVAAMDEVGGVAWFGGGWISCIFGDLDLEIDLDLDLGAGDLVHMAASGRVSRELSP